MQLLFIYLFIYIHLSEEIYHYYNISFISFT